LIPKTNELAGFLCISFVTLGKMPELEELIDTEHIQEYVVEGLQLLAHACSDQLFYEFFAA